MPHISVIHRPASPLVPNPQLRHLRHGSPAQSALDGGLTEDASLRESQSAKVRSLQALEARKLTTAADCHDHRSQYSIRFRTRNSSGYHPKPRSHIRQTPT